MLLSDLAHHDALRELADEVDGRVAARARPGPAGSRRSRGHRRASAWRSTTAARARESGRELPTEPHLFGKTENCVCGPFDDDHRARRAHEDRLRGRARHRLRPRAASAVDERDAWSYLAGVTCGQDMSDRGEQFRPPVKQFTIAKTYDTFGPIGPYLVTADELPDRDALGARRSGERRGHAAWQHRRPDLLRPRARGVAHPVHHVPPRRPGLDRHAGRGRRGSDAAASSCVPATSSRPRSTASA